MLRLWLTLLLLFGASSALAGELECKYDFVTHQTVLRIEQVPWSQDLSVSTFHERSPVGGDQRYIFDASPTPTTVNPSELRMVFGNLFASENSYLRSLWRIDFQRVEATELQYPERHLDTEEQEMVAPLVVWQCVRLD